MELMLNVIIPDGRKLHTHQPNMDWTTIIFSAGQRRSDFDGRRKTTKILRSMAVC
jgi:hypothetical protein